MSSEKMLVARDLEKESDHKKKVWLEWMQHSFWHPKLSTIGDVYDDVEQHFQKNQDDVLFKRDVAAFYVFGQKNVTEAVNSLNFAERKIFLGFWQQHVEEMAKTDASDKYIGAFRKFFQTDYWKKEMNYIDSNIKGPWHQAYLAGFGEFYGKRAKPVEIQAQAQDPLLAQAPLSAQDSLFAPDPVPTTVNNNITVHTGAHSPPTICLDTKPRRSNKRKMASSSDEEEKEVVAKPKKNKKKVQRKKKKERKEEKVDTDSDVEVVEKKVVEEDKIPLLVPKGICVHISKGVGGKEIKHMLTILEEKEKMVWQVDPPIPKKIQCVFRVQEDKNRILNTTLQWCKSNVASLIHKNKALLNNPAELQRQLTRRYDKKKVLKHQPIYVQRKVQNYVLAQEEE